MNFWNFQMTCRRTDWSPTTQRSGFTTQQYTAPVSTVVIEDCNKTLNVHLAHIYMHTCIWADGGGGTTHINQISNLSLSSFTAQAPLMLHCMIAAAGFSGTTRGDGHTVTEWEAKVASISLKSSHGDWRVRNQTTLHSQTEEMRSEPHMGLNRRIGTPHGNMALLENSRKHLT